MDKSGFCAAGLEDLPHIAKQLIQTYPQERVFAFYGEMGAGKTTFIQQICQVLGVTDVVLSPTFAIANEYRTVNGESIFHFDFYRLKELREVMDIGFEDYLNSGSYCFIEWPQLGLPFLRENYVKVEISSEEGGARVIKSEKIC